MRFFKDLILAGLVTIAVILALEGGLRLAQVHYEASLYQEETERGYALRPNAQGWSTDEAEVYVRINSDGLRDRERSIARPPHTLRVAVIGSSEVDARQVPLEKTFEDVLRRDLSRQLEPAGWGVDVINFGVPGYTLSQEYLTLRNHVWKYEPQVVILLFSAFPVLKNTRNFLSSELKGAPIYVLQNGQLVPDEITQHTSPVDARLRLRKNRLSDLMNRSDLLSMLNTARVKLPGVVEKVHRGKAQAATPVIGEDWLYNPEQPDLRESWAIADAFFEAMKKDCDQHGAEFWIVGSDLEMQVHPSLAERAAFQNRFSLSSLDLVDQRLERFGAAHNIPVLALGPPLGDYAVLHDAFLHGSPIERNNRGHWNEVGHQLVGDIMARDLAAQSKVLRGIEADRRQ